VRIRIEFDSATTEQVRALSVALNRVMPSNRLTLGVEGPEHWGGITPSLTPNQFAEVVARLCKMNGETFAEALETYRAAS
jgi:hypothetical protein